MVRKTRCMVFGELLRFQTAKINIDKYLCAK